MAGIDINLLPPLSAVKQITHEEIQADMAQIGRLDQMTPSDPAFRVMLSGSYRETLLRQECDEQVRAVMLATARGSDLDHIGVTYYRDMNGAPVHRLDGEEDEAYRWRLHDSPSGLSTAGPADAYEFHSRSAHPNIKQALCTSPGTARIRMYLLGHEGTGAVTKTQCDLVEGYLWTRRPLTDQVEAVSASIINYAVKATLKLAKTSDPDAVMERARQNLDTYVGLQHKMKARVTVSAIYAVLMVSGVEEVSLAAWADVICTEAQAPYCHSREVSFGGWADE